MKNRGMLLESIINKTIDFYRSQKIGVFHKKEIPITFSNVIRDSGKLKIQNGRIKTKSTTDYYGIYNGKFYAFEAKSTRGRLLSLENIKRHQKDYLKEIKENGGVAFFIIYFSSFNEFFILDIDNIDQVEGASISIEWIRKHGMGVDLQYPGIIDFLEVK